MKLLAITCSLAFCLGLLARAQQPAPPRPPKASSPWSLVISFQNEFELDGHIQVREWQFVGDKLDLKKDLGMAQWRSLAMAGEYHLKHHASVSLSVEDFFFHGHATVNKDIWFNGVHMSGSDGLTSSSTELYRIVLTYEKKIHAERKLHPSLCIGLITDFLTFRVVGRVLPDSWGTEQREKFARQTLPFPYVGAKVFGELGSTNFLVAEFGGTCIPEFKSFFVEGSQMRLQYATAQGGLDYGYRLRKSSLQVGILYRTLRILQESTEDTNEFLFQALGIRLRFEHAF